MVPVSFAVSVIFGATVNQPVAPDSAGSDVSDVTGGVASGMGAVEKLNALSLARGFPDKSFTEPAGIDTVYVVLYDKALAGVMTSMFLLILFCAIAGLPLASFTLMPLKAVPVSTSSLNVTVILVSGATLLALSEGIIPVTTGAVVSSTVAMSNASTFISLPDEAAFFVPVTSIFI